jgi:hypothetical protein
MTEALWIRLQGHTSLAVLEYISNGTASLDWNRVTHSHECTATGVQTGTFPTNGESTAQRANVLQGGLFVGAATFFLITEPLAASGRRLFRIYHE